jgi:uncharacterized membrane protein YdjX (TVP38/TMEM64 family)
MPPEVPPARRKLPLVKLGMAAAAALVAAILVLRGLDYRALEERGLGIVRRTGPWAFFAGTAVLPSVGAPLSVFTLTAGELFAPQMTMGGVIAATLLAIGVNLALTYWLARYALRPVLSRVLEHYGYRVPRVTSSNALSVALTLRLTPGPPFCVQSYILGLAEVPFRLYMILSWICILPWAVGAIVLGKGIFNGNFKLVLYGIGLIVVAVVVVKAIRKRYVPRVG